MQVIVKKRTDFTCTQYNNVHKIEFDSDTGIFNITYGSSLTVSFSKTDYILFVQIL